MQTYLKLFGILLICCTANAQDSLKIDQLHEQYKDVKHYQATFVQTKKTNYISKPLVSKGQLEFALNKGLIWEITHPLWVKTLITKKGDIYKSTKYHKKRQVKDFQIKLIAEIMTELLTANLDKIESHFKTQIIDNIENWQINLTPKKMMMKKTIKQIQLKGIRIDNELQGIQEIVILDNSANKTSIQLQNIITNNQDLDAKTRAKFE